MFDWDILSSSSDLQSLKNNILKNRNIDNYDEFVSPKDPVKYINDFDNEFHENVRCSKQLIFETIKKNQKIIIHGDYDADGVISTYILYSTIREILNYQNVCYIIPDRFEDGYGLSDKTVKKILELAHNQNFLLITVDCGITSVSQVDFLKNLGNYVIITDHHHKGEFTPKSDTLIWSDKVVGSTLSWILSLALGNKDPKMLTLVATATITDVFPLRNINRSLVKSGIEIFKRSPFIPYKMLLENQSIPIEELSVYHLGFVIGPRLNSSGRISDADLSVLLLNSKSKVELERVITELNLTNQRRQKYTEDSVNKFSFEKDNLPKVIILKDTSFHEGIVGLIASKIVQTYHRPALVITQNEDFLKGSARSIKGINIIEIIKKYSPLLRGCGGHELAAGFSIDIDKFELFKSSVERYFEENFNSDSFNKRIKIESELVSDFLNFDLFDMIESFSPFGPENEEPVFLIRGFKICEIKKIGKEKNHLSLKLQKNNYTYKGLFFNFPNELENNCYLGQNIDVVFKIKKNTFNNQTNLDLHILDMKESS